ncbi:MULTISPECIES: hypothetical protein [Nitratireductor]|jgi:hypothetical protein|uniref:DUF1127 domain-containing protein n=1 Tax=Nitratireductor basaltis TaxID=472175 RepID=A0A084UEB8_9HYPH|nr:hypothetical protein [Nitratireductor basaltis]KFB11304.1 hypothetical protein EL18_02352 [Nitratireductor basaltis]
MRTRKVLSGIGGFFDLVGSAMAVSAAVRDRRPARSSDLSRLGIDPDQFRQINRY